MENNGRVKSNALIAHLDMNCVVGPNLEADIDPIDMGMLNRVEQQFANRLKEQDANITCRRVGAGVGGYIHDNAVLFLRSSCQPCQGGRQSTKVQYGREEI